ncbi:hypothetical protein [Rufibacter roseus]|uniref:Uncharacterized protein n=1 Tax=Rufibacter roseus TaxID=1567108 RepID=A0ABW2DJN5_9BACT|nr:hypothetical protein [Rufibacter roseus]
MGIWHSREKQLKLHQFTGMYEAMQYLDHFVQARERKGEEVHVIIEDARLVKGNRFFAHQNSSRKDQGVGSVKGASKEWQRFCEYLGLSFELKPPTNTKVTPEYFESLTGLKTKKTESHKRDAGMLVIGR